MQNYFFFLHILVAVNNTFHIPFMAITLAMCHGRIWFLKFLRSRIKPRSFMSTLSRVTEASCAHLWKMYSHVFGLESSKNRAAWFFFHEWTCSIGSCFQLWNWYIYTFLPISNKAGKGHRTLKFIMRCKI